LRTPQRYVVATTILQDGKTVDSYETPFGIRTIEFTVTNGFLLNGKRVPLNGVCDHSDLGPLGSAINERGLERQIEILKELRVQRHPHEP
jgi:beta-galactosidase